MADIDVLVQAAAAAAVPAVGDRMVGIRPGFGVVSFGVPQARGPLRAAGLGDSNCFGYGGSLWSSFYESTVSLSGGKLLGVKNGGQPGKGSVDIAAGLVTDILPFNPDVILISTGTNDFGNNDVTAAYLQQMIGAVLAYNKTTIVVIVSTFPSRDADNPVRTARQKAVVDSYASKRVLFVDAGLTLGAAGTGFLRTDYSVDNIHTSIEGGTALGRAILVALNPLLDTVTAAVPPTIASSSTDALIVNGTFPSTLSGFSSGAPTVTRISSDPEINGGYARTVWTAGSEGYLQITPPTAFNPIAVRGRRLFVSFKIRITSSATSYAALIYQDIKDALTGTNIHGSATVNNAFGGVTDSGGWRTVYFEFDVDGAAAFSAGTRTIGLIQSIVGGSVTIDVAEIYAGVVGAI